MIRVPEASLERRVSPCVPRSGATARQSPQNTRMTGRSAGDQGVDPETQDWAKTLVLSAKTGGEQLVYLPG